MVKKTKQNKIRESFDSKRTKCEIWSRAVGYLRPIEQWHSGKQAEFEDRKVFKGKVN